MESINSNLIDFCNYVQPIVNGCVGFIKTEGYMIHFPGNIVAMSADETVCAIIKIPVIFDIYLTAEINKFLALKEDVDKLNLFSAVYFTGYNIKAMLLESYYHLYTNIDNSSKCVFYEPDCYNLQGFREASSDVNIRRINVTDGISNFVVPASKSITQLNKSDVASMRLYEFIKDPTSRTIKTLRYTVYKTKNKLYVDIFSNILVV